MLEDLSAVVSLIVLASIPIGSLLYLFSKLFKHKKEKVLTTSEKYYREW